MSGQVVLRHDCPPYCHRCPDLKENVLPVCWGMVAASGGSRYNDLSQCTCDKGRRVHEDEPLSLPERIKLGLEWSEVRREDPGEGALGCCDQTVTPWVIRVRPGHPVGEQIILLHEVLHAVDDALRENGIVPDSKSEEWVTNTAPLLLHALSSAGLWRNLTHEQVEAFMDEQLRAAEPPGEQPMSGEGVFDSDLVLYSGGDEKLGERLLVPKEQRHGHGGHWQLNYHGMGWKTMRAATSQEIDLARLLADKTAECQQAVEACQRAEKYGEEKRREGEQLATENAVITTENARLTREHARLQEVSANAVAAWYVLDKERREEVAALAVERDDMRLEGGG